MFGRNLLMTLETKQGYNIEFETFPRQYFIRSVIPCRQEQNCSAIVPSDHEKKLFRLFILCQNQMESLDL